MSVQVTKFRANLVALILCCYGLSLSHGIALSPARQNLQYKPIYPTGALDESQTALARPKTNVSERKVKLFPVNLKRAVPHYASASSADNSAPSGTGRTLIDTTSNPNSVNAFAGAAPGEAAAIAEAAVGSAAASAGAAATAKNSPGSHFSAVGIGGKVLAEALGPLNIEKEIFERHSASRSDRAVATTLPDPLATSFSSSVPSFRQSPGTGNTVSEATQIGTFKSFVFSKPSLPNQAAPKARSTEDTTAHLRTSFISAAVPSGGSFLLFSPYKRDRHAALENTNTVEALALQKDDSQGEASDSALAPVFTATSAPDDDSGTMNSSFLSEYFGEAVVYRKPDKAAWLCRISEPYKGCHTRAYYPGMNDRTYDGHVSAGRSYPGATCPEGFCCSRTACSPFGCGNICSDNSFLCVLNHESKSQGRGCSCRDQPAPRCDPLASCHESLVAGGGVWCQCPQGYRGNGLVCCDSGTPGCDRRVRRPGVGSSLENTGNNVSVNWLTLYLLLAACGLHSALQKLR